MDPMTLTYIKEMTMKKKSNEKGVTVVEYAIMLALIAIAVAVAAPNITSAVVGVFGKASSVMQ
jgi:Flp pilus assembly pilin Flp